MGEPPRIVANDRTRLVSTVLGNLGTALFAAAFGRWFLEEFDAFVLIWLVGAVLLLWSAWYALILLRDEE